jgi:hypothetical protein
MRTRGNPRSICWMWQWQHFNVVPTLEALSRFVPKVLGRQSQRWALLRAWVFGAPCTLWCRMFVGSSSRSGQVMPPSRLLMGGLYVSVYLPRVRVMLSSHAMDVTRFETLCPYLAPLFCLWLGKTYVCCVLAWAFVLNRKASCFRFSVWFPL